MLRDWRLYLDDIVDMKKLPPEVRAQAPGVPWKQIAGFRDRLAHGYFDLADEVIWDVIQQHLPELRREADRLRNDPGHFLSF